MIRTAWSSAQVCRERIAIADLRIGAFTALSPEVGGNCPASPINGLPIAVKANIAVAGLPFSAGISAYRDRIAKADARCVARLREAGVIPLGLTNMDEGALGAMTDNPWYGRTRNPWSTDLSPGGSSGGSAAAVAAGLCAAALGTDTFGSVRIPAAYCGLFGLKPAHGAISLEGVVPLAARFDHVGIIAPSATLCRQLLEAIGDEPGRPVSKTPAIVLLDEPGDEIAAAFLATRIADAALDVRSGAISGFDHGSLIRPALLIAEAEAFQHHRATLDRDPDGFGTSFRKMLEWGGRQTADRIASAHLAIDEARMKAANALADADYVLSLCVPGPAHAFAAPPAVDPSRYTLLASILGWAAVAFPVGIGPDGLPRSAQVMARTSAAALALAERLAADIGPPPGFPLQAIN